MHVPLTKLFVASVKPPHDGQVDYWDTHVSASASESPRSGSPANDVIDETLEQSFPASDPPAESQKNPLADDEHRPMGAGVGGLMNG